MEGLEEHKRRGNLGEGGSARITGRQWLTVLVLLGIGFMLAADFSLFHVAEPQKPLSATAARCISQGDLEP